MRYFLIILLFIFPKQQIIAQAINGTILNQDDGTPLAGATIILKNSNIKTQSNIDGKFSIPVTDAQLKEGVLLVTYVGYFKQEIRIASRNPLNIRLVKETNSLNDVVVTSSYAKPKRKEEVTGSIVTVSAAQLQTSRPIESFDKMLEGLAAGVQVEQSTELGTPVKINIRGQNALTPLGGSNSQIFATSSQPLFVVDGIVIKEQRKGDEGIAFLSGEQLLNPLAGINPDDIESISILKDAAAAAIYGSNASNGVIIITTKRGKAGKTRFNFGYNQGWSTPINQIKWLSGPQYHELVKEMYLNDGRSPFDAELLAGSKTINTDWFGLVNRYSSFRNVDFDMSGGNENTQFRLSASYMDQQATQKGNDLQTINLRLSLSHQIGSKFNVDVSIAPTLTNKKGLNLYSNVPIIPNAPAYNADGSFFKFNNLGVPNPLAVLAQNVDQHTGGSITSNVTMRYAFKKNLKLTNIFGINGLVNKQNIFDSPKNATGESKNGFAQIYDRLDFGWVNSTVLNWNTIYKNDHSIDIIGGTEFRSESSKLLRGAGSGFTYYRLNELSNAANQLSASSRQENTTASVYGQLVYNYKNKYFVSASSRLDAASIFGNDVNSTINNSFGVGWLLSKEKWFDNKKWIDMLRVRVSYGTTGNSRIGSYAARGLYTFSNTGYMGNTASSINTAPNPDLGWERSIKQNYGLDFNFLKRFEISVDVYSNLTKDAISSIPIPPQNGFTSVLANVATMKNSGFDFALTAQILTGKFNWRTTINGGFNENIIVSVKDNSFLVGPSTAGTVLRTGVSTSAIWGFRYMGVDPATGRELYLDAKDQLKLATDPSFDRNINTGGVYLGDRLPKLQGGWINTFSYKNLSVTINFVYSFGSKILVSNQNENNGRNLSNRNQSVNLLDRWQQPGDIANTPKLSQIGNPLLYTSSRYLYDGTFIRLSNLSISYSLPEKWQQKFKIRATIFANGTNLWYWYKQKSPEGRNGIREYRFSFPEMQTFTWGARVSI
ncbi:MAG: SusC/RagA family TonB-linked outer membrane protein [Chitinophagaceae bacterium]